MTFMKELCYLMFLAVSKPSIPVIYLSTITSSIFCFGSDFIISRACSPFSASHMFISEFCIISLIIYF